MASPAWTPLLGDEVAALAHAAIDAIAEDLRALPSIPESPTPWSHNLSSGTAGRALFHAYHALARPDRGDDEHAMELVGAALDAIAAHPMDESLFHGLVGIAWTVEHLGQHFYDLGDVDPLVQIDKHILSRIEHTRRDRGYELMRGLVGHGVYALERMPRPSARSMLSAVVDALDAAATKTEDGIAWFTPPEHLGVDAAFAPHGYYNLGLAHGMAGVLPLLARCVAVGVEEERSRRLLDGAVRWLLARRRFADNEANVFPAFVMAEETRPTLRAGWCYGDPGLACALEIAGRICGQPAWREVGRATALRVAGYPFEALVLEDASLCHGACGTGHLFHRMYRATGEPALASAARTCFAHGLAMRTPGSGVGGFRELDRDAPGSRSDSPGLLGGAAGIGLALMAAVTDHAPHWDAVFLVGAP